MTKKGILKLMVCLSVLGGGIAVACSTTDDGGTKHSPHEVNLINELIGTYTPINGVNLSIVGLSMEVNNQTLVISKLENDKYIFNVDTSASPSSSTMIKIEFTENAVVEAAGPHTQKFVYLSPTSATLENLLMIDLNGSPSITTVDISLSSGELTISSTGFATKQ